MPCKFSRVRMPVRNPVQARGEGAERARGGRGGGVGGWGFSAQAYARQRTSRGGSRAFARERLCVGGRVPPGTQKKPYVRRGGSAQAHARRRPSRGRVRAGALGAPAPEHKQERGRDEAAVAPRAASGGLRGAERGPASTLSAPEPPPGRPLARPPRAHHEPGESERRGRRRPAAVRQLQPGQHVRPGRAGVGFGEPRAGVIGLRDGRQKGPGHGEQDPGCGVRSR